MVLCRRLFDQLLQFTALVHFDDDIAAAHQFTVYPQLRESRPVGVFRQLGADIRVLQNINVSKTFATGGQRLNGWAETAAGFGDPFMYNRIGFQRFGVGSFLKSSSLSCFLKLLSTAVTCHCSVL